MPPSHLHQKSPGLNLLARHYAGGRGNGRETMARGPLLALGIAGTILILAVTQGHGPGISPDSVAYFAGARHLLSGHGLMSYDMAPIIRWPPLYPALLCLGPLAGMHIVDAARYLNAATCGAVIFVSGVWLSKALKRPLLAFIGTAAVASLYPLFLVSVFALSEPLFILLTLLFLLALQEYIGTGKTSRLATAAVLASLACMCRYIGVTVVMTGLVLLLARRGVGMGRRFLDAAGFLVVSIAPLAAWLYRNYAVSHSLTGERGPSVFGLMENVSYSLGILSGWFMPQAVPYYVRVTVFLWLIVFLAINRGIRSRLSGSPAMSVALFFLIYTGFLIASSSAVGFDSIDDRLLSPAGVPLIMLVFYLLDNLRQPAGSKVPVRAMKTLVVMTAALWLLFPLVRLGRAAGNFAAAGPGGYSSDYWKKSELIGYLKMSRPKNTVFSDIPDAVYFFTGISAGKGPIRHPYNSSAMTTRYLERFGKTVRTEGKVDLVWFDSVRGDYYYTPEDLGGYFNVRLVKKVSDGAIYEISPGKGKTL